MVWGHDCPRRAAIGDPVSELERKGVLSRLYGPANLVFRHGFSHPDPPDGTWPGRISRAPPNHVDVQLRGEITQGTDIQFFHGQTQDIPQSPHRRTAGNNLAHQLRLIGGR